MKLSVSRDDCPTCQALRDSEGRLPIGPCGPDCLGRKQRDAARELAHRNAPEERAP